MDRRRLHILGPTNISLSSRHAYSIRKNSNRCICYGISCRPPPAAFFIWLGMYCIEGSKSVYIAQLGQEVDFSNEKLFGTVSVREREWGGTTKHVFRKLYFYSTGIWSPNPGKALFSNGEERVYRDSEEESYTIPYAAISKIRVYKAFGFIPLIEICTHLGSKNRFTLLKHAYQCCRIVKSACPDKLETKYKYLEDARRGKYIEEPSKIKPYVLVLLLVLLGISSIIMGMSSMIGTGLVHEGPQKQTNVVVTNIKMERVKESRSVGYEWVTIYSVYLDFSGSEVEPEISHLLGGKLEEMRVDSLEEFNRFRHFATPYSARVGYHLRTWKIYPKRTLVIESVDGVRPATKSFDWSGWILDYPLPGDRVRGPGYETALWAQLLAYGGLLLGIGFFWWRRTGRKKVL